MKTRIGRSNISWKRAILHIALFFVAIQQTFAGCCVEYGEGCDYCPFYICLCATQIGAPVPINQGCGGACTIHLVQWYCNTWPQGYYYCQECLCPA